MTRPGVKLKSAYERMRRAQHNLHEALVEVFPIGIEVFWKHRDWSTYIQRGKVLEHPNPTDSVHKMKVFNNMSGKIQFVESARLKLRKEAEGWTTL